MNGSELWPREVELMREFKKHNSHEDIAIYIMA